jgi:hypothetical protein
MCINGPKPKIIIYHFYIKHQILLFMGRSITGNPKTLTVCFSFKGKRTPMMSVIQFMSKKNLILVSVKICENFYLNEHAVVIYSHIQLILFAFIALK